MTAGIIDYGAPLNSLVSVRGHPFERDAFEAAFQGLEGVAATFVDQPAAGALMTPDGLAPYDALVLYDMPGIHFGHADAPGFVTPPDGLMSGLAAALDQGIGIVALHHAIAGWPAWEDYADWLGGRFCYRPMTVRGEDVPDSGYRHDVTHTVSKAEGLDPLFAPIFEGVPETFQLTDELYLSQVFEADVIPLFRSDARFEEDAFYSAQKAVQGEMFTREGWSHAPGSNHVGWVKRAGRSPLVYLQFGDGPETYANETFQRLLGNAIRWVASDAAKAWARSTGQ